jgi:hypothetical protein
MGSPDMTKAGDVVVEIFGSTLGCRITDRVWKPIGIYKCNITSSRELRELNSESNFRRDFKKHAKTKELLCINKKYVHT